MQTYEEDYKELISRVIKFGEMYPTRTGMCKALFDTRLEVDFRQGFPLITGRKMYWKNVEGEAQWMLSGSTNVKDLHKHGVHIWDKWADDKGDLGPTYGKQLHKQWSKMSHQIINDPYGRRHIIDLWDVDSIDTMALPPCYFALQFHVRLKDQSLNLTVTSRSSDIAVGLPYDIAVLAYLLFEMCRQTGYPPGRLTFNACNSHYNVENEEALRLYLKTTIYRLPTVFDMKLRDYVSGPNIKMIVKP